MSDASNASQNAPYEHFLRIRRNVDGAYVYLENTPTEAIEYYCLDDHDKVLATMKFDWGSKEINDALSELRQDISSEALGNALDNALGANLKNFLVRCAVQFDELEQAAREHRDIRITLRPGASELYALPWELVQLDHVPGTDAFDRLLCLLPRCTIRYQMPGYRKVDPVPARGRLLFAWSHGIENSVPYLGHRKALGGVVATLAHSKLFPGFTMDELPHASIEEIERKLEQAAKEGFPYSLVHLLCHGDRLSDGTGFGLMLTDERGIHREKPPKDTKETLDKVVVNPARIARAFAKNGLKPSPHLVVLCACHGSEVNPGSAVGSVAQKLHEAGIESVLASRFPLSQKGSETLTKVLYGSLLNTTHPTSLEQAVHNARRALRQEIDKTQKIDFAVLQLHQNTLKWDTRPVVAHPYLGLRHYTTEHAPLFFGRNAEIDEACSDLAHLVSEGKPRLLMVLGASGTGKSSLVFAGIVPRLLQQDPPPYLTSLRPRDGVAAIETALNDRGDKPLLLVVDQFEEIFTDLSDEERSAFVQKLWNLARDKVSRLTVIATLRVDYLGRCGEVVLDEGYYLDKVANAKEHQVFVNRMSAEGLREVIEGPARWAGLVLEESLIKQMLNDAGNEPGALPLLQNALHELWQRRKRNVLQSADYSHLAQELTAKADGIIDGFADEAKKRAAKRLLVQLVDLGRNASPFTRRRVPKDKLRKGPAGEAAIFDQVLDELTVSSLVVVSENHIVEIAHEQIVRSWDRLNAWLKEERKRLAEMERFTAWLDQAAETNDYFLRGGELAVAIELREKYRWELRAEELELVDRSEKEAQRVAHEERRRQEELKAAKEAAEGEAIRANDALIVVEVEDLKRRHQRSLRASRLLEAKYPGRTRGWFKAAVDARSDMQFWMIRMNVAPDIRDLFHPRKERTRKKLSLVDGNFVVVSSSTGTLTWTHASPSPAGDDHSPPFEEYGPLTWYPSGTDTSHAIAEKARIIACSEHQETLLLSLEANGTWSVGVWKLDAPTLIARLKTDGPTLPTTHCGIADNGRNPWVVLQGDDRRALFLLGFSEWSLMAVLEPEDDIQECVGPDGRTVLVIDHYPDNVHIFSTVMDLAPWSYLYFLGPAASATFAPDGIRIEIQHAGETRIIEPHSPELTRGSEVYHDDPDNPRTVLAEISSPNGRCTLKVEQIRMGREIPDARWPVVARIISNDPLEQPLELGGPMCGIVSPPPRVCFSPDGRRIVMVYNGGAWLWTITSAEAMMEELRKAIDNNDGPRQREVYLGETAEVAKERYEQALASQSR